MATAEIASHREGEVTHIRLNRPAKRNALTGAMYAAMADALQAAEHDGTAVVIISGAGPGFCAGNDLADFVAARPAGEDMPVHRFLRALSGSTRIIVAAVQGRAVGVGTTMLLHCDFVVAETDALLQMPFVDLALVPEAASSLLVPQMLGYHRACRLLMLGETLDAARAEALGLAHAVVASGEGLAAAASLAARLVAKPRSALLATKRLMKLPVQDVAERIAVETTAFAAQLKTPEVAAIIEKFFAARATG